ncbi:hypothetical protein SK128_005523, partial [Halocaridina rubra]
MRSGSSFTARLLTVAPWTFYTEEPIREYLGDDVAVKDHLKTALNLLRDILQCQFSIRSDYYAKRLTGAHHHNVDTVKLCFMSDILCWDPFYNEIFCQAAQMRLVRLVNMELGFVESLLFDRDYNLKIIHLVRDPRGTLSSRNILKGVHTVHPKFTNVHHVCNRYRSDLTSAIRFARDYPD